jgi:hypothetical protein
MNIKENEVYTFKLTSGEELIAKVTGTEGDFVFLSEPLSVAPGPQGMGLVQSVFTSDEGARVTLNIKNVTMFVDTAEAIKQKYIQTTTGISVPSKKIVLG